MSFFDLFKGPDINDGINEMQGKRNSVLLDVRTESEYREGHIPGSINIPLDKLQVVQNKIPEKGTSLYVYCLSGARSRQAVNFLKRFGYTDVNDLGGIRNYKGIIEKGA